MQKKIYTTPNSKFVSVIVNADVMGFEEAETASIKVDPGHTVGPDDPILAPETKNLWDDEEANL